MKTILILAANPKDTPVLRLDEEFRKIEEALRRSVQREIFRIEYKVAVRPSDVHRAMLDCNPYIVHFSGHGAGNQGIILIDDNGQSKLVSSEKLTDLFKLFSLVECVFLNACYSEVQAKAIAQVVPYVVGMRQEIEDSVAVDFPVAFYDAIGAGKSIDYAYRLGCNAIIDIPTHLTPVLEVKAVAPNAAIEQGQNPSLHFNPYIVGPPVMDDNFYGYAEVVSHILTQRHHANLLIGMRRIGKTSVLKKLETQRNAVYLNLQRTGTDWKGFQTRLQREAIKKLSWLPEIRTIQDAEDVCHALELLNDISNRHGANLLLLLDEAEVLVGLGKRDLKKLQMFQSTLWDVSSNVKFLFASAKQLTELDVLTSNNDYGSAFLHAFPPPIYIAGLATSESIDLICQTKRGNSSSPHEEVIQSICQLTNNHPYFIQSLCFHLWAKNSDPRKWRIDDEYIYSIPDLHHVFQMDFDYLSTPERKIIRNVLLGESLHTSNTVFVQGLVRLGYLRQERSKYEIANHFFKTWLGNVNPVYWELPNDLSTEATYNLYLKSNSSQGSV